jgi:hypothetical protein
MSTTAVIRTGHGPIRVENVELQTKGEYTIEVYGEAPADLFEGIYITDAGDSLAFLANYADRRSLTLARNIPGYELALINSRHDSIRNVTITDEGVNLLQFIEPEFITLVPGDDN